jgi:DNA invertase Pin-like site-specific DNA recombinase
MWQMIGVLAELARSLITKRTRAGVKAAKHRGVKFGRKPKLTAQQITHARALRAQGEYRHIVQCAPGDDLQNTRRIGRLPLPWPTGCTRVCLLSNTFENTE